MSSTQSKRVKRYSRNQIIASAAIALIAFIGGSFFGGEKYYKVVTDIFGGGGGAGSSRGITNNSRTVPNRVSAKRPTKTSKTANGQTISSGVLKISVVPGQSNPFISTGASGLSPGSSITRSFVVTNTGSTPVTSISFKVNESGSQLMAQNMDLSLRRCSNGCTTIEPATPIASIGSPVVVYSGSLPAGQSLTFNEQTSMSSSAPSSVEGQTISLSYSITAVGG
jgi:hypothetical protein